MIHDPRMDRRRKSALHKARVQFRFGFLLDGLVRLGKGRVFALRIATITASRKGVYEERQGDERRGSGGSAVGRLTFLTGSSVQAYYTMDTS